MEPLSVFRTIWRRRWLAFPAIVLTLVAAALVFVYGPREYESSVSYAIVDPQVPTAEQLQQDPSLRLLNSNNPYLRSSDPNLIASVMITRLNAKSTQDLMKRERLSDTYKATPGEDGQGLIVTITASGDTARQSIATTKELGRIFEVDLRSVQKVNNADDRYLFTPIVVDELYKATEKVSSRLRTVIIVLVAGIILVFGAVSLGNAIDRSRRRRSSEDRHEASPAVASEAAQVTPDRGDPVPSSDAVAEEEVQPA